MCSTNPKSTLDQILNKRFLQLFCADLEGAEKAGEGQTWGMKAEVMEQRREVEACVHLRTETEEEDGV